MTRLEAPVRERRLQGAPQQRAVQERTATGGTTGLAATAARLAAGALVIATGAIHFYLYESYFSAIPTIGRLFLANFVASLLLGGLILLRRAWLWSALGAAFCLTTLGGFLVSVHWGLFGYQETLRGAWQERAAAVEIAGAVAGATVAALASWRGRRIGA